MNGRQLLLEFARQINEVARGLFLRREARPLFALAYVPRARQSARR
jgi:hypothetical protein